MARAPSLVASSRKEKVHFQRDGLRKRMIITEKIHFLYTTFLRFVKTERTKGQSEFILTQKLNHINLLQIVLNTCLPKRYKESQSYTSSEGNCFEPVIPDPRPGPTASTRHGSPLQRGRVCVECADTGRSPIGPKASARRPGNVSDAAT